MNALSIVAPAPGTLLGWIVQGIPTVEAGQELGELKDAGGLVHKLTAPAAGRVRPIARRGEPVEAGQELATLAPLARADAPQRPQRSASAPVPLASPSPPVESPTARHAPHSAPIVEELRLEPPPPSPAPLMASPNRAQIEPKSSAERLTTKNRTYSIGAHQERAIKRLALELALDDSAPTTGESELVRAALAMLLELPRPALVAVIERNKARERAGRYGVGRPRPGRARR